MDLIQVIFFCRAVRCLCQTPKMTVSQQCETRLALFAQCKTGLLGLRSRLVPKTKLAY